ncbi:hypothetical protein GY45DRAFT_1331359 [Cubamyces sp. BRFM 1775]|nr:hypothetical protein GY45DRAFT_1331359 [Cubamyces sp. BRFM 1775]
MDNPQYYQPLSHALHAPLVSSAHPSPRQQYASYASHHQPAVTNGAGSGHREEEEEEEDDDEEVVEEELDHHDTDHPHQSASSHSSPRVNAVQAHSRSTGAPTTNAPADNKWQTAPQQDNTQPAANDDGTEKRRPGRPRGSKNRKPRVSTGSASKPPANVAHPGFYTYPPTPAATVAQNQQFFEFQWRALNLCSEFYNAAEELVKAASPMVIAQCYQSGPATKIDPLMMIAEAKRVCDSLLANPSQLAGQPVPATTYPSYASMPPPPPPGPSGSAGTAPAPGAVITNPQTFVMPLNSSSMPPPSQPYYAPVYSAPPGSRYPTAPYYYPPPQGAAPYYPPPQSGTSVSAPPAQSSPPAPAAQPAPPQPAPAPPAPIPANTPTISTFNAATGNTAPGGHQGTWSEEETERLKRLAEQSKEMGGPQNKGEIEWDWVIQQWGNSRTRHQILLKATSLGLKESTTRGTKRRREAEPTPETSAPPPPPPAQQQQQHQQPQQQQSQQSRQQAPQHPQPQQHQHQHQQPQQHQSLQPQHHQQHHQQPSHQAAASSVVSPARSPVTSTPTSINASPAMQPQRPPSSTASSNVVPAGRTTSGAPAPAASTMPWPMPTVAINTPSPVMTSATTDSRNNNYYRPRPTQTTSYSAAATAASNTAQRPPSSHGSTATHHQYMYQTNGAPRRDSRA